MRYVTREKKAKEEKLPHYLCLSYNFHVLHAKIKESFALIRGKEEILLQ